MYLSFFVYGYVDHLDLHLLTHSVPTRRSSDRLETAARRLVYVADGVQPTGFDDPYGLCMYRSARDGAMYVFINGDDTGKRQWRLVDAGNGRVRAELVRDRKSTRLNSSH